MLERFSGVGFSSDSSELEAGLVLLVVGRDGYGRCGGRGGLGF